MSQREHIAADDIILCSAFFQLLKNRSKSP